MPTLTDTFTPGSPNGDYTPANDSTETGMDKRDQQGLEDVRVMTQMMREHAAAIARISKKRRAKVLKLREHRVTYREIAEAMGTTEQSVYKIIRGDM